MMEMPRLWECGDKLAVERFLTMILGPGEAGGVGMEDGRVMFKLAIDIRGIGSCGAVAETGDGVVGEGVRVFRRIDHLLFVGGR